ncbi:virus-induced RNA 1 [Glossina fuscipes fuscipes]
MKSFLAVVVVTLALNFALASPVPGDVRDDAEVIDGHRRDEDFDDFKGVIDTGVGYTFLRPNPQATAFNFGFYDSFEDILRRIKDALTSPVVYSTHDEDSDEIVYHMKRDPVKMNKTSTVKVIDGHKVEINDTQYNNKNSHFRVRVINIRPLDDDVKVGEANDTVKTVTSGPDTIKNSSNVTTPGSEEESDERREPLEKKPQDNEIRGNIDSNEQEYQKLVDYSTQYPENNNKNTMLPVSNDDDAEDLNAAFVADNSIEDLTDSDASDIGNGNKEFESNISKENFDKAEEISEINENTEVSDNLNESFSNADDDDDDEHNLTKRKDTELDSADDDEKEEEGEEKDTDDVGEAYQPMNKKLIKHFQRYGQRREDMSSSSDDETSELIEMHPDFNAEWGDLKADTDNDGNNLSNDIDVQFKPFDLSHDIAVNDIAAAQVDFPLNPDAEFIDVFGVPHSINSMPKFEKLSLNPYPSTAYETPSSSSSNIQTQVMK